MNTSPLSARGSPQDKNPNECASKIDRIRMWKLAKKSTEDHPTKISQPMRVTDRSNKNVEVGEEVHRRSPNENFPTDAHQRLIEEECRSWQRRPSKIAPQNFPTRCASKIDRRRMWMKCEDVHFPTDARQKLIKEECGSWRRSPSKVARQKVFNRCASKIDRRRMWKLAKKPIEDRSTKISQQMRVKD